MTVIGCIAIILAIVAALSMMRNCREASRERPTAYGELATDVDEENADDDDVERLERGAGSGSPSNAQGGKVTKAAGVRETHRTTRPPEARAEPDVREAKAEAVSEEIPTRTPID